MDGLGEFPKAENGIQQHRGVKRKRCESPGEDGIDREREVRGKSRRTNTV
jgi:hypothetical protein